MFRELTADASFVRIEEEVRRFWRRHALAQESHAARRYDPPYVIYEQALVAAGRSGADQLQLLATTDLLARYRTMRGYSVRQHTGWACHGLPVEVVVERKLGPDLANYDLAQFNAACREAAHEGIREGETLAERLGVWVSPIGNYVSMTPQAIGTVWGAIRRLSDTGRLRHERRIVSVCPRCATPLSAGEASRFAFEDETRSIWVRLPWDGKPNTYLLTWTATPWTLLGMVALAAHADANYALVEVPDHEGGPPTQLLLAEAALDRSLAGEFRLLSRLTAKSLRDARYSPPFTFLPLGRGTGRLLLSKDVPLGQGTGLLPVTPAFDSLSLALAQAHNLPVPESLDSRGSLDDAVTPWRGLAPQEANPLLIEDLRARGLLFEEEAETRLSALCPYCETRLLPLARPVWLVETASGPWIVGRDRAWGAPLPIWTCPDCGESLCVAGLDDLAHRTGLEADRIDPHRPAVDRLTVPCEACGGMMRRVRAVVDAAFEAAVLPWATAPQPGPADLAVGLGDKHLGWLGDLTEMVALLRGSLAWEQAVALPEGESEVAEGLDRATPADALRWAAYTLTTPELAERDFLRTTWRLAISLLSDVTSVERGKMRQPESGSAGGGASKMLNSLLDRWLLARLHQGISQVTEALDAGEPQGAALMLAALVDDLFEWYVPRRTGGEGRALETLSRLLAPFAPYLAEAVYCRWGRQTTGSVHLTNWPTPEPEWQDWELLEGMTLVQRLARLAGTARAGAGINRDRLLAQALVTPLAEDIAEPTRLAPLEELLEETLGVTQVQFTPDAATHMEWHLTLNRDRVVVGSVALAEIEKALADLEPYVAQHLALQLWAGRSVSLEAAGQAITLLPEEVEVGAHAKPGWAAAFEAGLLVVLRTG